MSGGRSSCTRVRRQRSARRARRSFGRRVDQRGLYRGDMRRMSVGLATVAIISGLLVVGGVIVFVAASPAATASFGWFAYQPIADATFYPGSLVVLTPLTAAGAGISVAGLVGLGVVAGFLLGRRRPISR